MKPMAEFVKKGAHLVVSQKRWLVGQRRRKVTGQIGDRHLHVRRRFSATYTLVHPRAATLVVTRVRVEVKDADGHTPRVENSISRHVGVPRGNPGDRLDHDPVETLNELEHSFDDAGRLKIRTKVVL